MSRVDLDIHMNMKAFDGKTAAIPPLIIKEVQVDDTPFPAESMNNTHYTFLLLQ